MAICPALSSQRSRLSGFVIKALLLWNPAAGRNRDCVIALAPARENRVPRAFRPTLALANQVRTSRAIININNLGYGLMEHKLFPQAVAVLRFNAEGFPRSANVWDSLADAYFHSGDIRGAVQDHKKALEIDSTYSNAAEARKFIASHSER